MSAYRNALSLSMVCASEDAIIRLGEREADKSTLTGEW